MAKKKAVGSSGAVDSSLRDPRTFGADCDNCPLRKHGPPVWGEGPAAAKLAIVGEAPGRQEIQAGRPFIGMSGQLLDNYLSQLGTPRSTVFVTNAVMCFPPGGDMKGFLQYAKKLSKEEGEQEFKHPVECCRPRLMRELGIGKCANCNRYESGPASLTCVCKKAQFVYPSSGPRPVSVSGTGNMALMALHGVEGILRWRGSAIPTEARAVQRRADVIANLKK